MTTHWNKFICPLMWRLKWLELKIKELQSQDKKYDSQLAKYAQIEQSEFDAMSKLTKRKKRKRVEDTTNIASYMSQHNLFSYGMNSKTFLHALLPIKNLICVTCSFLFQKVRGLVLMVFSWRETGVILVSMEYRFVYNFGGCVPF